VRDVVCFGSGNLDEVSSRLDLLAMAVSQALVGCVIDLCGRGSGRRLSVQLSQGPRTIGGKEALERAIWGLGLWGA